MYDPGSYESNSDFQRRDANEIIPYLIDNMDWTHGNSILDFGCGSGYVTMNIILPLANKKSKEKDLKLTGIDISEKMIEFASINYKHEQINWMILDIIKDKPNTPKFDKVFSGHVFHWIHDQKETFQCLYELLNNNGEIGLYFISNAPVFSVYANMAQNPKWSHFLKDTYKFIPSTHFSSNPEEDITKMLVDIGFLVQESTRLKRKFSFESLNVMTEAALAANPFVHKIPISLLVEYKHDFKEEFRSFVNFIQLPNNPDSIQVHYDLLLIRAKKSEN